MTIKEKCISFGVNYSSVISSMRNKGYSGDEAIMHALNVKYDKETKEEIKNICNKHSINIKAFYIWCDRNNKNKTKESLNEYIQLINNRDHKSNITTELENKYGCRWYSVKEYMRRNNIDISNISIEEAFIIFSNNRSSRGTEESLTHLCKEAGISKSTVTTWCRRHNISNLSDKEKLQAYIDRNKRLFSEQCRRLNININAAFQYRKAHPELTDEQIIMHYRPDCYINWLGELVIPT